MSDGNIDWLHSASHDVTTDQHAAFIEFDARPWTPLTITRDDNDMSSSSIVDGDQFQDDVASGTTTTMTTLSSPLAEVSSSSVSSPSPLPLPSRPLSTSATRKRVRHRQIDANRRSRESSALDRLRQSVQSVMGPTQSHTRPDRVMTLNNAADTIALLVAKMNALTSAGADGHDRTSAQRESKNDSVAESALHSALSGAFVAASLPTNNLFAEVLLSSSVMQAMFDIDSGECLFLSKELFARNESSFLIPRSRFLALESPRRLTLSRTRTVRGSDGSLMTIPTVDQPPSTMEQFRRLYTQQVSTVELTLLVRDLHGNILPLQTRASTSTSRRRHYQPNADHNEYATIMHVVFYNTH